MKKLRILFLTLLAAFALAGAARADVIAGPAMALYYGTRLLPWILVGAAAGVTVYLLRKFWKKKK